MTEVFRTDVANEEDACWLAALLQSHYPGSEVSFDLEDCDKVLRVKGDQVDTVHVARLLHGRGFACHELE